MLSVLHCVGLMQGDWGTQFGMLIQYLEEDRPAGLADPSISELAIADLQVCSCLSAHVAMHRASVWSACVSRGCHSCALLCILQRRSMQVLQKVWLR